MKADYVAGILLLCTILICTVGCSKKEKKYTVTGTVTYQGELVPMGSISFDPGNGKSPDGAPFENGKYTAQVRAGKMTVRITGSKLAPPVKGDPDAPGYVDYIPVKHHAESTLTVEINGDATHDFKLE